MSYDTIDIGLGLLLLLFGTGVLAGWIDAVVGGGGLVQLPVLLLVPGMSPVQAVATNKLGSVFGTAVSATTYLRAIKPDKSVMLPGALFAMLGAIGGAMLARRIPSEVFDPLILIALVGVALFTLLKPELGTEAQLRFSPDSKRHHGTSWAIGLVIGFYDGMIGPGTGSFLVIALVGIVGFSFLQASATAKVMNLATNIGALLFFVPAGLVVYPLGLAMAAGNMIGGFLGARMALRKGSGFVRVVFLVVVAGLVLTLGWEMLAPLVRGER